MTPSRLMPALVAATLFACTTEVGVSPAEGPNAPDLGSDAGTDADPTDPFSDPNTALAQVASGSAMPSTGAPVLTRAELDVLNRFGLGLTDDPALYGFGVGDVEVTSADTGATTTLEGVALQFRSDDRYWDNTLVFAWSGLDPVTETVDQLLRFRAAGLAEAGSVPLDFESNLFLPSWVIASDAIADTIDYNEAGTLTIADVTLDPATATDCSDGGQTVTCTLGTVAGMVDMTTTTYAGFGTDYAGPDDRGPTIGSDDFTITYDLPVLRLSFDR